MKNAYTSNAEKPIYVTQAEKQPTGTYSATVLGLTQTATFKGNTLTLYNRVDGKRVYEYEIISNTNQIRLRNVATGRTFIDSFKYVAEYDTFVWDDITYNK